MPVRLRAAAGKIAIYTVPTLASTDNAPLTNPDNHADRLRFHSDRNYVRVISTHTGSLTLPARAQGTQVRTDHLLFAHGQASEPMVMGRITNLPAEDGTLHNVPIASMVPVLIHVTSGKYAQRPQLHRWVCLAVDATNVYLREYGFVAQQAYTHDQPSQNAYYVNGWTAQTINWVVHLTDFLVTGPAPTVDMSKPALRIDASKVEVGYGKFTSEKRIPRLNTSGTDYAIPTAQHILYEVPAITPTTDSFGATLEVSLAGMWWRQDIYQPVLLESGPTFTPNLLRCDV